MKPIKLYYFDSPGRGQPIREILKYGKISFEDIRIKKEEWLNKKNTFPLKQVPAMLVGDDWLCETVAILTYAATLAKIRPEDPILDAKALSLCLYLNDIVQEFVPYMLAKPENKESCLKNIVKSYEVKLKSLDQYIKASMTNSFTVGGKLSYADFCLYTLTQCIESAQEIKAIVKTCPCLEEIKSSMQKIIK